MLLFGKDLQELGLSVVQKKLLQEIDLELWLTRHSNPVAQNLTGRTTRLWTDNDVEDLETNIVTSFSGSFAPVGPPPNAVPSSAKDRSGLTGDPLCAAVAQIISKIIETKSRTERISPPRMRIVSAARYPTNPFSRDAATAIARVKVWRSRLGTTIRRGKRGAPASRILILLSAALYGGIFDSDLLIALARALEKTPGTLGFANEQLYVQISAAWRGAPDFSQRTWYPDPLTATLIAHFVPGNSQDCTLEGDRRGVVKAIQNEMIDFFRAAGINEGDNPASLDQFLKDLRIASQVRMPSVLAAYAAHSIRSEGLPARALKRIYSVRPAQSIPVITAAQQQSEISSEVDPLADNPEEVEPDLERELRKILKQTTKQVALKSLNEIRGDRSLPLVVRSSLILEFAEDLLSREGKTRPVEIATVQAWVPDLVEHIGLSLQTSYGLLRRSRFCSDELEEIYRKALEEIDPEYETPAVRERLVRALRAFHEFLERKHRVKHLLDTSLFLLPRIGSTVDANLITVEEYKKILNWLDLNWPSTLSPGLQPLACVMVIFGFRCGLRREEALALNWFSICSGGPKPELLVQPYPGHRLKSSSAKRRLPLHLLLEKKELEKVLEFARKCQTASSGSKKTNSLFSGVTARRLLKIIHTAMRTVTKDPSIKFHHLRHSFATWTFMRFMIGESGRVPKQLVHLTETRGWLADSPDFCKQTHDILPATTRLNAYLLAQMMGHSSPSITFRHYIHGVDWLLDSCLRADPESQPKRSLIALAGGVAERTAYNHDDDTAVIPARLIALRWPEMAATTVAVTDPISLWPWRSWNILYRHFGRKDYEPGAEAGYGFSEDEAVGFFQRATYLRDMRPRPHWGWRGGGGRQHSMIGSSKKQPISCPMKPLRATDISVVDTLAPVLSSLMKSKPELIPVMRYYADNVWKGRSQLFFRNPQQPEDAIAFLKLLEGMEIDRKQIRLSVFHKMERRQQFDKWIGVLGFPENVIPEQLAPPIPGSDAYDDWIGIEPCLSNLMAARSGKTSGLIGFRFLMLMAHVVYGKTEIEQVSIDLIDTLREVLANTPKKPGPSVSWLNFEGPHPKRATLLRHPTTSSSELSSRRKRPRKTPPPPLRVDELMPSIENLLLGDGPFAKKPYTECKRLLVAYFQAISETFPDAWADHKCKRYALLRTPGLRLMIALLPDIMRSCNLREDPGYNTESFKRQLEPLGKLTLLGGWHRSTVVGGMSTERKRMGLLCQLRDAIQVEPPSIASVAG